MRAVFFLFSAALSVSALSAGSLSGRATDASGAAVPGAVVTIVKRDTGVRTSARSTESGDYRFASLPAGEYLLEARSAGLGTPQPVRVRIEDDARADLLLAVTRESTVVQVTAAGIAQSTDEQSKALDILNSPELEARAEFSVAEALRVVPGIRVAQVGGPGSLVRVLTRGLRATDTSFLIDGFRLRDAASPQGDATALIGDLLLSNTERVEILRGSGSSLYGTHATGGVINVITDQGGGAFRGSLDAEGGGLGLFRSTARFSGGAWENRLRLAGGATHLNVTRGIDGNDRARNSTGHGFAQLQLGPATVLTGRVLLIDGFVQLNDSPFGLPGLPPGPVVAAVAGRTFNPSLDDPDQRRSAWTSSYMAALAHNWTPGASTRISYSLVDTRRDTRDGPAGVRFEPLFNNSSRFDGRIDTAQARTDVHAGRSHLFSFGYEFEREEFDNRATDENPNPAARTNARLQIRQASHAGFAQAQGRYLDGRLQVLLSGRLQRFSLTRPLFSGNSTLYQLDRFDTPPDARTGDVSVLYMIARTGTKFRAHTGNGYRAPALYERFGASFFGGRFSGYGDPRLKPERVIASDAGIDQYLFASKMRLSGTYFYTSIQEGIFFDFSGAISPATDPWGRFGGYRNTRGGIARGAEFSVQATPVRSLTLFGSYTYTRSQDRVSQYGNSILRSPRIPHHMFTATALQRVGRRLDLAFDLSSSSAYYFPVGGRAMQFEGPAKADISASWTQDLNDRQKLRFFTRVENLLNRTYFEEGFRTPKAWATAGVKWLF